VSADDGRGDRIGRRAAALPAREIDVVGAAGVLSGKLNFAHRCERLAHVGRDGFQLPSSSVSRQLVM